jgi:hypothetical protein
MENHEFEVGSVREMQDKFGWTAENWSPPELQLDKIPKELHDLVPWVLRFGVACDVTRHDVASKASDEEFSRLADALCGCHDQIEDFLYDSDSSDAQSDEQYHFGRLLIFESEECGGPGIHSPLEHAVRKCRQGSAPKNLRRLRMRYQQIIESHARFPALHDKYWEPILNEARHLLGINTPES